MKQIVQLVIVAVLSSIATILIFQRLSANEMKAADDNIPVRQATDYRTVGTKEYGRKISPFLSSSPTDFIVAANEGRPTVVFITAKQVVDYNFWTGQRLGQSSGSGVIISSDGYIVTNNHVVENAEEIKIELNDNREYSAQLVGTDPTTDLALLKIEESGLSYIKMGDSDSLQIGEWVVAVGNPFGLQSTVTAGIISAMGRNINILNNEQYSIESFIQTDAVVNPGNSGGALVNTNGELIGINTAIISQSGQYEGYSFAVPINLVQKVVQDLKEFGAVQRGLLGVQIVEVNEEIAENLGLEEISGILVSGVFPNSGADEAGLKRSDVIVAINDVEVEGVPKLQEMIGQYRPGDEVKVSYIRNGQRNDATLTLKNQINSTEILVVRKEGILKKLGIEVRDLSREESMKYVTKGVKILSIKKGSTIDMTNMIPNYIVTSVNGRTIENTDEFIDYLDRIKGKVLLEGFYEDHSGSYPYSFRK